MFNNGQLTALNIKDILPNRFQPRIKFDEEKLEELAESISKYGVIQPIVVRPVGNKFEIIAGERRFKASKLANRSTIPAILVNLSDKDSEEIALLENVQRQQLSPIEEAVSYKRILDMGYITQEELARKIGKSQSTIANKIRLLNLDDEVQSYLLNNKISERHARSLLRISDKEKQVEMLHRIVDERLTVKQTDKEIARLKEEEKNVTPIDLNIPIKHGNVVPNRNIEITPINQASKTEEIESLFDDDFEKEERGNNMDIDKIMREAKDINDNSAMTSPRDISNLMSPNGIGEQPLNNQSYTAVQPMEEVNLEPNKFINVAPQPESPQPQMTQPINNGVTFDSMFNQPIKPVTSENTGVNQNSGVTSTGSSGAISSSVNVPQSNNVSNSIPEIPSVQANIQPGQPSVQLGQDQPTVNPTPTMQSIPEVNLNDTVNSGPNIYAQPESDEVSPDTKRVISTAVASALKKYKENKTRQSMANSITTPPTPESLSQTSVPSLESTPTVSTPSNIPDTSIIADDTLSEYANGGIPNNAQPTMASAISQDVRPVVNQSHFADIVKLLRDCADKIEQNGYFVNVDELDLGNQYKVTFTIDKE